VSRAASGVLACSLAPGAVGLSGVATPADPVAAEALWAWAEEQSGSDLTHSAYVDATEAAHRLRPWHPGFALAQQRLRAVDAARSNERIRRAG